MEIEVYENKNIICRYFTIKDSISVCLCTAIKVVRRSEDSKLKAEGHKLYQQIAEGHL